MRGTILGVHGGQGVLLALDERRFEFPFTEWRSVGTPVAGQVVDFVEEGGQARGVFAVPGATSAAAAVSGTRLMSWIAVGCLLLGLIIPLLPTIAAYVLGVIGAGQARTENDDTSLVLARIAWIGALVLFVIGVVAVLAVIAIFGTLGFAAAWHGLGPMDF